MRITLLLFFLSFIDAQFALPSFQAAAHYSNYVLNLNGTDEYAYYADNSNFEPANWSIQAWIDPSAVPTNSDNDWFIHKNQTYRLGLEYTASGVEVIGSLRYSGSYHNVNSGDQSFYVTTGSGWYHVVLTFDGTNLVLYVNGDEKDTNSNSNYSTNDNNSVFSIGRRDDTGTLYFNGKIDDVSFWNTSLSANAVAALYKSGDGIITSSNSGNYTSSSNLVLNLLMQRNLNDSKDSYNFTGVNIGSDDYEVTRFDYRSQTFSYTGSQQTFTVASGITSINLDAYGAEGGIGWRGYTINKNPGKGGRVQATLSVTAGEVLYIFIGGKGSDHNHNNSGEDGGGGGGGGTDIRSGGTAFSNRILAVGGGGGSGTNYPTGNEGGDGGGLIGQDGEQGGYYGYGGTQSAGGTTGGALGEGGDGSENNTGAGGGGGYYGGGGSTWEGGGGGSSWVTTSGSSSITHTQGARSGHGVLEISW